VPEGGCTQRCNLRLECGHTCESLCHAIKRTTNDPTGHSDYLCKKLCVRELTCGHPCERLCHECKISNKPCNIKILKTMEPCKHVEEISCF